MRLYKVDVSESRLVFEDKERVGAWVAEQVEQRAEWGSFYAMGAEVDGKIVSGVVFNNFNECNATAHIACSKPNKLFLELRPCIQICFRDLQVKTAYWAG